MSAYELEKIAWAKTSAALAGGGATTPKQWHAVGDAWRLARLELAAELRKSDNTAAAEFWESFHGTHSDDGCSWCGPGAHR